MPLALRYTFEFDAGTARLLDQMTIDKHTPPSYEWKGVPGASGFWWELRNDTGEVMYRRVADDPYYRFEGPVNDRELRTISPVTARSAVFSLVVPFLPAARSLVIMASRPPDAVAQPIAIVKIDRPV